MKINVMNIPEEGLSVPFSKEKSWAEQVFAEKKIPGFLLHRVDGSAMLKRIGHTLYLEGNLQAAAEMDCSRCLEVAHVAISAPFKYILTPAAAETAEEKELRAEELDFVYYSDDLIDIDPLLAEQLLLQIPMKILCREDCKGLCPHCGVNMNADDCQCREKRVDVRLAVLNKLKI
jgi:uncharacterized protein